MHEDAVLWGFASSSRMGYMEGFAGGTLNVLLAISGKLKYVRELITAKIFFKTPWASRSPPHSLDTNRVFTS